MPGTSGPPASLATEVAVLRAEFNELQKRLDERRDHDKEALSLQAKEYERRLAGLNHEAEQLRRMQATYLPREVYEAEARELRTRAETLKLTATEQAAQQTATATMVASLSAGQTWLARLVIGAVLSGIVALAFQFVRR